MFCSQCGSEIPEGSIFCNSCGTRVAGEAAEGKAEQATDVLPHRATVDAARAFILAGFLAMVIGTFLPWMQEGGFSLLGVNMPFGTGPVICAVAVLYLAALVLSRSGAAGGWNYVMLLLSLLAVALVFQFLYFVSDNDGDLAYGYWITMSGTLIITIGGFLEQAITHRG